MQAHAHREFQINPGKDLCGDAGKWIKIWLKVDWLNFDSTLALFWEFWNCQFCSYYFLTVAERVLECEKLWWKIFMLKDSGVENMFELRFIWMAYLFHNHNQRIFIHKLEK